MLHIDLALTQVQARHRDLLTEAERARRLALAETGRAVHPAALRRAIAGLGARRGLPATPTTASAAT